MMKQEQIAAKSAQTNRFNRIFYALFLILVLYMVYTADYESAIINLGIALIFDPFDSTIKWSDRPIYQKMWLTIHALASIAGILYLIYSKLIA